MLSGTQAKKGLNTEYVPPMAGLGHLYSQLSRLEKGTAWASTVKVNGAFKPLGKSCR
jgi:hypothetical protein